MRTYVIGDIHGCYHALLALMNKLPIESDDKIIFLGDYIDRGLHSKQVIDYVKELTDAGKAIALMGNHEKMCIDTYRGSGHWGQTWRNNGADKTIDSYDTRTDDEKIRPPFLGDDESQELRAQWHENLPRVSAEHVDWMQDLPLYYEDENFLYVHAGINPETEFEYQCADDLLWIRGEFINYPHNFKKRVVFGHTPFEKPQLLSNKIGLDTGCVYGNFLSAMCMESGMVYKAEHDDRDGTY